MPKDRREDRHAVKGRLIRPEPEDLWEQVGKKAGPRRRNKVLSALMQGYLDGRFVIDDEVPPTSQ